MAGTAQPDVIGAPRAMDYQGVGIRFVSILIDGIVIGLIEGIIGMVLGIFRDPEVVPWWWWILSFVIYIAYFTYLEGTRGQTVGKMITRIKVVREDGGRIDMNQSFTRNILRIIDGLIFYLVGAVLIWRSDRKQRLGDSVAKTVVVKA
ncbi:MAG TPA: RDD family protein [Methanotrichaceae archaeon]|nr:RDD family protein [Methanotrichaceae archaeon]